MRGRTLTEGPVLSGLLTFCGPVLLALILQALYGAVDLWAVGRFGTTADISAVSTGSQTMQMVIGGITGLSMGVTVLLGLAMGRGDDDGAARAVGASLWVFGLLGAALSLVMVLAAGPIARGMNAPAEALDQTADYIRICGGGSLCIAAYNLLSAIFRGMGDARSPLVFVAIACVVNVAGDLALIRGLGLGGHGYRGGPGSQRGAVPGPHPPPGAAICHTQDPPQTGRPDRGEHPPAGRAHRLAGRVQ